MISQVTLCMSLILLHLGNILSQDFYVIVVSIGHIYLFGQLLLLLC